MEYARFESELTVRPDDIDMNSHVHTSRYLDYVLHARYDQMERCYGMPIDEFLKHGWNWYVKSCQIEFKRSLGIGDTVLVRTWLDSFEKCDALVRFQIFRKATMKVAAEGSLLNTMVDVNTGRPVTIPDWVIARYTQFTE